MGHHAWYFDRTSEDGAQVFMFVKQAFSHLSISSIIGKKKKDSLLKTNKTTLDMGGFG